MTRGQRNNNPLNIRRSADRWKGARTEQTDKNFVQFETMAYGYRAAWKVLESYWKHFCGKCEAYSVRNIIGRWAPPDENDTENYIRTVVKLSGLGGTVGTAGESHDHGGVRHPVSGGGCNVHPRRFRPCFPRQTESEEASESTGNSRRCRRIAIAPHERHNFRMLG